MNRGVGGLGLASFKGNIYGRLKGPIPINDLFQGWSNVFGAREFWVGHWLLVGERKVLGNPFF